MIQINFVKSDGERIPTALVPDDFNMEWVKDYSPEILKANGFKCIEVIRNVPAPPPSLMAEVAEILKGWDQ